MGEISFIYSYATKLCVEVERLVFVQYIFCVLYQKRFVIAGKSAIFVKQNKVNIIFVQYLLKSLAIFCIECTAQLPVVLFVGFSPYIKCSIYDWLFYTIPKKPRSKLSPTIIFPIPKIRLRQICDSSHGLLVKIGKCIEVFLWDSHQEVFIYEGSLGHGKSVGYFQAKQC